MTNPESTLRSLLPVGFLATRQWLLANGVPRHLLDNWLKSEKISPVARGVFVRPDTVLTWQGVVASLQRMGIALTPGGLTALAMQGLTHYLSPREQRTIQLYGTPKLPEWANTILPTVQFSRRNCLDIDHTEGSRVGLVPWQMPGVAFGVEQPPVQISSPELAIMEVLMDVPAGVSLEHASLLLDGLPTLSPIRLSRLLAVCPSVKVKRLFLWLAEETASPWLARLDLTKLTMESGNLGAGKRMIVKGGILNAKYQITVPREFAGHANQ
ncbi:MAG TPA: type IV toxin-antitoxin system AbiEi family antitoxin domain-containing protein [Capsulimonadaceae bacterium]|jgi:hypothetical protein